MNEKIVVAVKGIVLKNKKVLIVKREEEDEVGAGTWEMPGGKIEFGEKLEDALIREIKEEVGLEVIVGKLLYATTFLTDPSRQVVILTYLCKTHDDKVILSTEHTEYRWAEKEEMLKYLNKEILKDMNEHDIFMKLSL